jgi:hypothetical protein
MKLTTATLPAIERHHIRSGERDRIVFDDRLKGFGLRLQGNRRTWIVQYRVGRKQHRLTLGSAALLTPDEGRRLARLKLAKVRAQPQRLFALEPWLTPDEARRLAEL